MQVGFGPLGISFLGLCSYDSTHGSLWYKQHVTTTVFLSRTLSSVTAGLVSLFKLIAVLRTRVRGQTPSWKQ